MSARDASARHYFLVAKRILEGEVVPFLGAGANLCGRPDGMRWAEDRDFLPDALALASSLAAEVGYPDPDDHDLKRISQYVPSVLGWKPLCKYLRAPLQV